MAVFSSQKDSHENNGLTNMNDCGKSRTAKKSSKYVECWGADKPFANITETTMAKNIGLTVIISLIFLILKFLLKLLIYI